MTKTLCCRRSSTSRRTKWWKQNPGSWRQSQGVKSSSSWLYSWLLRFPCAEKADFHHCHRYNFYDLYVHVKQSSSFSSLSIFWSAGKIRAGHTDDWKSEQLFVPPLPPTNLRWNIFCICKSSSFKISWTIISKLSPPQPTLGETLSVFLWN